MDTHDDQQTTLEIWLAEEAAAQARLAPPGVVDRNVARGMSGLEFLQAISAGQLPQPAINATLGQIPISAEAGRVVFQGRPGPDHYNPSGGVHGGYAATMLDSALACAIQSMLPVGKGMSTLELKVNYIRGMTQQTGPVRAEGKVISVGGQVGVAEGRITDAAGKLYAFATTTCIIFAL